MDAADPTTDEHQGVAIVPCADLGLHTVTAHLTSVHDEMHTVGFCDTDPLLAVALAFGDPIPRLCSRTSTMVKAMWDEASEEDRVVMYWAGLPAILVVSSWFAAIDPEPDLVAVREVARAARASGVSTAPEMWRRHQYVRGIPRGMTAANLWPERGNLWTPVSQHPDADVWIDAFDGRITEWAVEWWDQQNVDAYTAFDLIHRLSNPNTHPDATGGLQTAVPSDGAAS